MKPIWAIQKALISDTDSKGMREDLTSIGVPYTLIEVLPFDNTIPVVDYDGPIIPYGGTKFIENIRKNRNWACFFNDNFRYHIAVEKLGQIMFNSDGIYMKMKDFCPSMYKGQKYLFIRPDKDLKEFAGNVVKPEDFMGWYRQLQGKGLDVNDDTEIIVAKASKIDNEWRTYVVDGKVVSGSRYRQDHYMSVSSDVPQEVYDFVADVIKVWQPSPVFVMDVCQVNKNIKEFNVLEIGDLHSCGWYASDKRAVIKEVSEYVERIYCPIQ